MICTTISAFLVGMGYRACSIGEVKCDREHIPYISKVLATNIMYDRIFLLLTIIMMFGVMQVNIRAYYKKLYGVISDAHNDKMMFVGLYTCFALPMIGVFDCKNYLPIHGFFAVTFFACFAFYGNMLGSALYKNIDKYPESQHKAIQTLKTHSYGLIIILLALGVAALVNHVVAAILEWALVLYFINYFSIAAQTNEFYDSVHDEDD